MTEMLTAVKERAPMAELMDEARDFFADEYGLVFDDNNQLTEPLNDNQVEVLEGWRQSTFIEGIEMPDITTFARKAFLAQAIMPQRNAEGNITYLFGKGIGAEITLQGEVAGRNKRHDAPYRPHADFEIYAINEVDPPAGFNTFRRIFGNQETYPVENTKGLRDLPVRYLHDTAEEVSLGGVTFLVPRLEAQFVDKLEVGNIRVETNLRGHSDAELLAQTYELDRTEVHDILDRHVIQPAVQATDNARQLRKLKKLAEIVGPDGFADATIGLGQKGYLDLRDYGLGAELLGMDEPDAIGLLDQAVTQALAAKHERADQALMAAR
ncbi:MAG TPA: hypothetical protein VFM05_02285 [Candidatus Saccharimonadales bacterium]|nr:hypothetical protein [Candidatus Saccharimonadales bacterium]